MISWKRPFSKIPTLAALRRAVLRAKRIANQKCAECGARLFPGDGKLCEACRKISRRATAVWRKTHPEASRQQVVAYRNKNRSRVNAYERTYYARRKSAVAVDGTCLKCAEDALEDSLFCAVHREKERAKARRYQARKRARLADTR